MNGPEYRYYEGKDGWRWRLQARNGQVLASGEGFMSERNVLRAIETVQAAHGKARLPVVQVHARKVAS